MSAQMIGRELDEIVRELYVLPPTDFVAARNELVRQARAAGSREVAERLQQLRRPTRSAWLVNLLARDPTAMQRLSALGRELRDAQTGLARTELRDLAEQRRHMIADLLDRSWAHAAEATLWQSEFDLADAEAAVEAAEDAVSSLDTKRIEARRDKVTAQRHLTEAQSRQRDAVNALAEARRRLDTAQEQAGADE
jgi:hypothetical protein